MRLVCTGKNRRGGGKKKHAAHDNYKIIKGNPPLQHRGVAAYVIRCCCIRVCTKCILRTPNARRRRTPLRPRIMRRARGDLFVNARTAAVRVFRTGVRGKNGSRKGKKKKKSRVTVVGGTYIFIPCARQPCAPHLCMYVPNIKRVTCCSAVSVHGVMRTTVVQRNGYDVDRFSLRSNEKRLKMFVRRPRGGGDHHAESIDTWSANYGGKNVYGFRVDRIYVTFAYRFRV